MPFWVFAPWFPFIFAVLGLHFLHFWLVWAAAWGPPHKLPKTARFLMKFKQILSAPRPAAFCNFWPFRLSCPFILAFWAFISFHFGFLGLHFLSFWPFGLSFPFILAFWAFISFHFGLLGFHFLSFWPFGLLFCFILAFSAFIPFILAFLGLYFLSFWPFGLSFPFILAFWAFISFDFWLVWAAPWGPAYKLQKTVRFRIKFKQIFSAPRPAAFCNFWPFRLSCPFILAFWAFISFHFGVLGFHFLSFWFFRRSFPFILAFWAFISFDFWLVWAAPWGPAYKLQKTVRFRIKFKQIFSAPRPAAFCNFWPFRLSCPFILAFWAFISFHFGVLGFHFLSFWFFRRSFPFILAFWAFISFHFGLLGLHFLSFWRFGLSFPFILAFWAFISFIKWFVS